MEKKTILKCHNLDGLTNTWGSVRIEDNHVRLYLDYPEHIVKMFASRHLKLRNPVYMVIKDGALRVCDGGFLRLSDKPDLAALVARGQELEAALAAERELVRDIARAEDQRLIDAAEAEAQAYRATCPPDCALVETIHNASAADGWGATDYHYQGCEIPLTLQGLEHRAFSAVRLGALNAFHTIIVAWAPRPALAAHLAEQERRAQAEAAKPKTAPTRGPGYCYNCETYCFGDCGSYAPEYGAAQWGRDAREMAREMNCGINDNG